MSPPFLDNPASSRDRSPYRASLVDVVARFGGSESRRRLLSGLLDFRAALHAAGAVRGFQWIDGSFVENAEFSRGRAPGDIDAVTFFHVPEGYTEESFANAFPDFFNPSAMKWDFGVDAYLATVNLNNPETIARRAAIGMMSGRTPAMAGERAICKWIWTRARMNPRERRSPA